MVQLQNVLASNAQIATSLPCMIAVFAGATTGIGEATLKKFVHYAIEPHIYLIARSQAGAEKVVSECKQINPKAQFDIVIADLTFVKETDRACGEIKSKENAVNLLVLSAGEVRLDRKGDYLPIFYRRWTSLLY